MSCRHTPRHFGGSSAPKSATCTLSPAPTPASRLLCSAEGRAGSSWTYRTAITDCVPALVPHNHNHLRLPGEAGDEAVLPVVYGGDRLSCCFGRPGSVPDPGSMGGRCSGRPSPVGFGSSVRLRPRVPHYCHPRCVERSVDGWRWRRGDRCQRPRGGHLERVQVAGGPLWARRAPALGTTGRGWVWFGFYRTRARQPHLEAVFAGKLRGEVVDACCTAVEEVYLDERLLSGRSIHSDFDFDAQCVSARLGIEKLLSGCSSSKPRSFGCASTRRRDVKYV